MFGVNPSIVAPKLFQAIDVLLQTDDELLVSEMHKNGGHRLRFRDKAVESYPGFEKKLAHEIQHGLQGFIVKNIEGESKEANDLSHILYKRICCVNNSKCCQHFNKI